MTAAAVARAEASAVASRRQHEKTVRKQNKAAVAKRAQEQKDELEMLKLTECEHCAVPSQCRVCEKPKEREQRLQLRKKRVHVAQEQGERLRIEARDRQERLRLQILDFAIGKGKEGLVYDHTVCCKWRQKGFCPAARCSWEHPDEWKGVGNNYRVTDVSDEEYAVAAEEYKNLMEEERKKNLEKKRLRRGDDNKGKEPKSAVIRIPFPDVDFSSFQ